MAPPQKLILLIGAHKTASSHLQSSLLSAKEVLTPQGIALIAPSAIRKDLTPLRSAMRDGLTPQIGQAAGQAFLDHHGGQAQRFVLMDENIVGGTEGKMLMRPGKLYPWAPRRIQQILSLFPHDDIEIGLAVRSPATFLPSCWGESLNRKPYQSFVKFMGSTAPQSLRWSGLVSRIEGIATSLDTSIKIFIWRFEDYHLVRPMLYDRILGPNMSRHITPEDRILRPGLSANAVAWIEKQETPDKNVLRTARLRFPKEQGVAAYDPWTPEQHRALDTTYVEDLKTLSHIEDVELLHPRDA